MRFISFPFVFALTIAGAAANCTGSSDRNSTDGGMAGRAGSGGTSGKGGSPGSGGVLATGGTGVVTSTDPRASGGSGAGRGGNDGGPADAASSPDGMDSVELGQGGVTGTGGTPATDATTTPGTNPTGGTAGMGRTTGGSGVTRQACSPPAGYRNLFVEVLGKTQEEVDAKLVKMVQQLFHGSNDQKIYYEMGDQAQIYDTGNGDVRSEGQSYGMMIAVQMDMRAEFDKLWSYAASCMRQANGTFTWSMQQGSCSAKQTGFAPDGEEYFAMALLLASRRWDTSTGIDYGAEAKKVLKALATQLMFSTNPACVYFTMNSGNSDPSYVLPLFYSEWACFDADNASLWDAAATHARTTFFPNACNKQTGLAPEHSGMDGAPQDDFGPDAWRVPMNIMMDYNLNHADPTWQESYAKTQAAFWTKEGLSSYGDRYSLSGEKKDPNHGPGQDGVNAMLSFGLPTGDANAKALLQRAWDAPMQTGQYRYYNGCLQMLSFLHTSGRFGLFYQ